jgi:hypothetical protein
MLAAQVVSQLGVLSHEPGGSAPAARLVITSERRF